MVVWKWQLLPRLKMPTPMVSRRLFCGPGLGSGAATLSRGGGQQATRMMLVVFAYGLRSTGGPASCWCRFSLGPALERGLSSPRPRFAQGAVLGSCTLRSRAAQSKGQKGQAPWEAVWSFCCRQASLWSPCLVLVLLPVPICLCASCCCLPGL